MEELVKAAIADITLGQFAGYGLLLVVAFCSLIEITPIKVNPISIVMRWIGQKINGQLSEQVMDLNNHVQSLDKKLDDQRDAVDDNEIDRIRWEILDFANSCRLGKKHTLDEFDHIIELNEKYHNILKRRNLTNGKIDLEYNYIVRIYRECQEKNSFL